MFLISVRNCNGMEKLPLFSVLIANYNNGCYLQDAIDSVLAQNYDNWEIVIVDDKSTDNSFEIYEKYKNDGRFHVFFNEENIVALNWLMERYVDFLTQMMSWWEQKCLM